MAATHSSIVYGSNKIVHYSSDVPVWSIDATNIPTYQAVETAHENNVTTAHDRNVIVTALAAHIADPTAHMIDTIATNVSNHAALTDIVHGMLSASKVVTWTGALTHVATLSQTRFARVVTLSCEYSILGATVAGATCAIAAGAVDVAYRPTETVTLPCRVVDDSIEVTGYVTIGVDGAITVGVGATQAAFQNGGGEQAQTGFCITYMI